MRLFTILASLILALPAVAQSSSHYLNTPICDTRTANSTDGVWSVRIEPAERYGQGDTHYAFSRGGAETWSGNLPVFLRASVVTRDGTLMGWGWTGDPEQYRKGTLHVVAVTHTGQLLLDEATPREVPLPSCFISSEIDPHVFDVAGLLPIEERDMVIVRFTDGEMKRSGEEWRRYRLSTGQAIDRFRPRARLADEKPIDWSVAIRVVPSTPLVLCQWRELKDYEARGFCWMLCDAEANVVWELDLPTDISALGEDGYRVSGEINNAPDGGILALADHSFEIRLCKEAKRARFEVVRAIDGTWTVREVERVDLVAPSKVAAGNAKPDVEDDKPVQPLGIVDLSADDPPRSEVHDIQDFDIDDHGRFVFSRPAGRESQFDVVRANSDGTKFDIHRLPQRTDAKGHWSDKVRWIHGDTLIANWNVEPHGNTLCVVSLADGSVRELPESVGYSCHQIERTANGGFVVLCDDGLMAFDAECHLLWRRTKSEQLCGGGRFAQDARGRIVVVDSNYDDKPAIQRVSSAGKIGEYTKLANLPTQHHDNVRADPRGAWWMTCPAGWVRIDAAGKCEAPFEVRRPDGLILFPECMRIVADDSLWVSSDGSLFHLTPKLEVDRVIGDFADDQALRDASLVQVDASGKIAAVSQRTGNVFVLDEHGKRQRMIRADPADFPHGSRYYREHLEVREDGSMIVGDESLGSVAYDAEGKRLGARSKAVQPNLLRQAGTGRTWSLSSGGVALMEANGSVAHSVDKSLDGTWLNAFEGGAVAPDGSLAIFIEHGDRSQWNCALATFGREGELKSVHPLGAAFVHELAWDGKRAAFIAGNKLCVVDRATGKVKTLSIATGDFEPSGYTQIFLVREGREVWVFDGHAKIRRYAVPRFD